MEECFQIVIASRGGPKLDLAQKLNIADSYITLSETDPDVQMNALHASHPYGFDIVVEATGSPAVLESALLFVRKGGKVVVYGVYGAHSKVSWSPQLIWEREITILASFCETMCVTKALGYLESGKVRVQGIAERCYRLEEWGECLEAVRRQEVVKAVVVFE